MGKCLSKIRSRFSVSKSSCEEKKTVSESPVRGVVYVSQDESTAFMKKYSFSTTNAAFADFESPASAAEAVAEAAGDHEQPSGCLHLIRSPSSRKVSEDPIADSPLHVFEESGSRKEGPGDSALTKCSSRKRTPSCSVTRSPSRQESPASNPVASANLNEAPTGLSKKSPSRNSSSIPTSIESQCSSCLFLPRCSISKELPESVEIPPIRLQASDLLCESPIAPCLIVAEASLAFPAQTGQDRRESANVEKPCGITSNVVHPSLSSLFELEKESPVSSEDNLPSKLCSICKELNCNCSQTVTAADTSTESSELEVVNVSQLSGRQEAATDAPRSLDFCPKETAMDEESMDVKSKANGSLIRQSAPSAASPEVYPAGKSSAEMNLLSAKASGSYLQEISHLAQNAAVSKTRQCSMINKMTPNRTLGLGRSLHLATSPTAMKKGSLESRTRSTESFKSPGRRINATQPKRVHINKTEIKLRSILKELPKNCASIHELRRPYQLPIKTSQEPADKRNMSFEGLIEHDQSLVSKQIEGKDQKIQAEPRSQGLTQRTGEDQEINKVDQQIQEKGHAKALDQTAIEQGILDDQPQISKNDHKLISGHFSSNFKSVRKKYLTGRFQSQNQGQELVTKSGGYNLHESSVENPFSAKMISMLRRNPKKVRDMALRVDSMIESGDHQWRTEVADPFRYGAQFGINGNVAPSNQKKRLSISPDFRGKRGRSGTDNLGNGGSCCPHETITPNLVDKEKRSQVETKTYSSSLDSSCDRKPTVVLQSESEMDCHAFVESVLTVMSSPKQTDLFDLNSVSETWSRKHTMYSKSSTTTPTKKTIQNFLSPQYDGTKSDDNYRERLDEKYGLEQKSKSIRRLHQEVAHPRNSQRIVEAKGESSVVECKHLHQASARATKYSAQSTEQTHQSFQRGKISTLLENKAASIDHPVKPENEQSFVTLVDNTGSQRPDPTHGDPAQSLQQDLCSRNVNISKPNEAIAGSSSEQCASNASNLSPKEREDSMHTPKESDLNEFTFADLNCAGMPLISNGKSAVASPTMSWGSIPFIPTSSVLSPEEVAEIWGAFEAIQLS